jgi:(R)-2-hydroxyacyl-CoA dehydratese activating ATPase
VSRVVGVDIGSRTIKVVVREDDAIVSGRVSDTTFDPIRVCLSLVAPEPGVRIVATGYGRHLFQRCWPEAEVVTEIRAVALGAARLVPGCRGVVDVGGQDVKVVAIDERGRVARFAMNDRCSAGTGRFLEVMATALAFGYQDFVEAAQGAIRAEKLSSMCTVFAESEVVSLVARGADRAAIALGIHEAVAARIASLAAQVPLQDPVVFAGGGALDACLVREVSRALGRPLVVLEDPQVVAAFGCTLV